MPSTYSPVLDLQLMATGEDTSTWGINTNANLSTIDSRLGATLALSVAGNSNITVSSAQAENLIHDLTGALTGNITYTFPNPGVYFIENNTTGAYTITVLQSGGTGIVVPQGTSRLVMLDGNSLLAYFGGAGTGANSDITSLSGLTTPLSPAQGGTAYYVGGTTGGSANAQTLATVSPSNFALTAGNIVTFVAGATNTGSTTLNVNTTGAETIYKQGTTGATNAALTGGELLINQIYSVIVQPGGIYTLLNSEPGLDGTNFNLASTGALAFGTAPVVPSLQVTNLTASELVATDGSKNLTNVTALPSGTTAVTQSANDGSAKVATTAYVDTSRPLGAWSTSFSSGNVYHAATDGFVLASTNAQINAQTAIVTDSSSSPSTTRANLNQNSVYPTAATIMSPVRKGDYWEVTTTGTATVLWIPLGV